jgi:hypothetical protein
LPPAKRTLFCRDNTDRLCRTLDDTHFFEMTKAAPMLPELVDALQKSGLKTGTKAIGGRVFLPAPKTWMEYIHPLAGRVGLYLEPASAEEIARASRTRPRLPIPGEPRSPKEVEYWNRPGVFSQSARVTFFFDCDDECLATDLGLVSLTTDDICEMGGKKYFPQVLIDAFGDALPAGFLALAHIFLMLINSPNIIGRRKLSPHRGLARKISRNPQCGIGTLHDWHEIRLG